MFHEVSEDLFRRYSMRSDGELRWWHSTRIDKLRDAIRMAGCIAENILMLLSVTEAAER